MINSDELYTIAEVAKIVKMTPQNIREMCNRGSIKAVKLGAQWRIAGADLLASLQKV